MHFLKSCSFHRSDLVACFSKQGIDEEPASHANAAVNAPHGEFDTCLVKRLAPGEDMLIDAVHERAIEIEEEGNARGIRMFRGFLGCSSLRLCPFF
jgi:hypothetical protein